MRRLVRCEKEGFPGTERSAIRDQGIGATIFRANKHVIDDGAKGGITASRVNFRKCFPWADRRSIGDQRAGAPAFGADIHAVGDSAQTKVAASRIDDEVFLRIAY